MRPQHVFWFCIITSSSPLSKTATSPAHEKNETNFNLQGAATSSSKITTLEPKLAPSDIRSEVQDVITFLPTQTIYVDVDLSEGRSRESNNLSAYSLPRNSGSLGEVSIFDDNSEHRVKNSSSGSVESTNNYETLLHGKTDHKFVFGSSTKEHVPSEPPADVDTRSVTADFVPFYYDEDEYVTGNEHEEESTANEVTANTEVSNNKESLLKSKVDHITLSEPSARENNAVRYMSGNGDQSVLSDNEIRGDYDIVASSTAMTINNRTNAPNDSGETTQTEPDYAAQQSASENISASHTKDMPYVDKMLRDFNKTNYTGSSTTATVTNRIKTLSSIALWGGIHRPDTSEGPAERYRTLKHTLNRDREPSRSPYQVQSDYADDYYEVWRRNRGRSTTMSATESKEVKVTDDKNQQNYMPYFPTEQDAEHTFITETVKNFYASEKVTNDVDHDSTVREEGLSATTGARKTPVSRQDGTTSENIPQTVEMEPFRVLEKVDVVNNNVALKHWEEKYNSIATTNNGSSAVSEPPMSRYRTSRRTHYTKTNKFNCSTNESECSVTPQGLAAFDEHEEVSAKSINDFESASVFESRAQRESLRKVSIISDDFAICEDCDTEATDTKADLGEARVLQLRTTQNPASDISTVPENYDVCEDCLEEETDMTVFNNEVKTAPEPRKQQDEYAKSKLKEGKRVQPNIMANTAIQRKAQRPWAKIVSQPANGVHEKSFSDYPWFVTIQTSTKGMRCAGAMVTPRWLLTASSCLRSDDTRSDAYSAAVKIMVNVTGKQYRAVRAVFAPGGGVALVRLQEPAESALLMTGRLDVADPVAATLWTRCVTLGMGRWLGGGSRARKTLVCTDHMYAAAAWAMTAPEDRDEHDVSQEAAPRLLKAQCSGDPGSPLACHRYYSARAGLPLTPAPRVDPPENEPTQLVLVGVSVGDNKLGLSCRGRSADYWNVGPLQEWVENAIVNVNRQMERTRDRTMMVPPDPYAQRLHRMQLEGSLPEPRHSRGPTSSGRHLPSLLAAIAATPAASRMLLAS